MIDQCLRVAIDYPHPLTKKDAPKYLDKIVAEQIENRLAWEADREARAVRVDLSQLAGIRAAANATCDSLLIDEEREDEAVSDAAVTSAAAAAVSPVAAAAAVAASPVAEAVSPAAPTPQVVAPTEDSSAETTPAPYGLTAIELELLQSLLDGTPWEVPAGTSLDMLVDSINEKLFDLLGDTALEFDGLVSGMPAIIDDYAEDVREALSYE